MLLNGAKPVLSFFFCSFLNVLVGGTFADFEDTEARTPDNSNGLREKAPRR